MDRRSAILGGAAVVGSAVGLGGVRTVEAGVSGGEGNIVNRALQQRIQQLEEHLNAHTRITGGATLPHPDLYVQTIEAGDVDDSTKEGFRWNGESFTIRGTLYFGVDDYLADDVLHFEVGSVAAQTTIEWVSAANPNVSAYVEANLVTASKAVLLILSGDEASQDYSFLTLTGYNGGTSTATLATLDGADVTSLQMTPADGFTFTASGDIIAVMDATNRRTKFRGYVYPGTGSAEQTTGALIWEATNSRVTVEGAALQFAFPLKAGTPSDADFVGEVSGYSAIDSTNALFYSRVGTEWRYAELQGVPWSELTIATGVITITTGRHTVDTQSDAATDDLDTINGGFDGQILVLRASSSARDVVVKDATGNLNLNGDFTMDSAFDTITLIKSSSTWLELARSSNA